jgi:hypothetical protein
MVLLPSGTISPNNCVYQAISHPCFGPFDFLFMPKPMIIKWDLCHHFCERTNTHAHIEKEKTCCLMVGCRQGEESERAFRWSLSFSH